MEKENPKRKHLLLSITEKCNLDCVYCYQGNKRNRDMTLPIAKAAISKYMNADDGFDEVEIELSGGEPFLRFDFIKVICEWVWNQKWEKPYIIFITTNGTLIKGEIRKWIEKNCERLWLAVSLDGSKEMHDKNRSNSYDLIDFPFFLENWPNQPVKMTVSRESLETLAEGVIHIHELGFQIDGNLAYGIDWTDEHLKEVLTRELKTLADYYIENPDLKPYRMLDMALHMAIIKSGYPVKWCGCGTGIATIDTNGDEYPCHLFLPNAMDKSIEWKDIDFTDESSFIDPNCDDCFLLPICPTCYGVNLIQNGDLSKRDKALCGLTKIRALAVSYLLGKKIEKGLIDDKLKSVLKETIESIKIIQEKFN